MPRSLIAVSVLEIFHQNNVHLTNDFAMDIHYFGQFMVKIFYWQFIWHIQYYQGIIREWMYLLAIYSF